MAYLAHEIGQVFAATRVAHGPPILDLFYLYSRALLAYLASELGPVFAATRVTHGPPHEVSIFIDEHGKVRVWGAGVAHYVPLGLWVRCRQDAHQRVCGENVSKGKKGKSK